HSFLPAPALLVPVIAGGAAGRTGGTALPAGVWAPDLDAHRAGLGVDDVLDDGRCLVAGGARLGQSFLAEHFLRRQHAVGGSVVFLGLFELLAGAAAFGQGDLAVAVLVQFDEPLGQVGRQLAGAVDRRPLLPIIVVAALSGPLGFALGALLHARDEPGLVL